MSEIAARGFRDFRQIWDKVSSVWALIILIPALVLVLDQGNFTSILTKAGWSLAGTLPIIMIAVLLLSYLKASGAEAVIARAFVGQESRMILLAAMFGGLAPFCACEVIPFIAGLLALGVPLSAVMAFWLSSPLIDPGSFSTTAGVLGWEFALGKTVAAVALGVLGGYAVKFLVKGGAFANPLREQKSGGGCRKSSPFDGKPVWAFWKKQERRDRFVEEMITNGIFLFKWLTLAYLLQGLLTTYVSTETISQHVGGEGFLPIIKGALIGAPAYLNSYAAPAVVNGLMEQGMSNASAMAFMIAGSVSSIPAMSAVWSLVNRQVFAAYLFLGISGAVILGWIFGMMMRFI